MANVLLLGGKGYIGSRVGPYLASKQHNVTSYDLCWFGDYTNQHNIIRDYKNISEEELVNYDAVIVLSAHSSVKMCINDYMSSYNNNVRNVVNLIGKLGRVQNVKPIKLIYASSSSIYGNTYGEVAEESKKEFVCTNNYDLTKFIIDQYMLNNLPLNNWFALRFGTVNGYSRNFRSELMINSMTRSAIEKQRVVISNKHINRAILGVSDLCEVMLTLVENATEKESGIYNINSTNSSVESIAHQVAEIVGVKIEDQGSTGIAYDFKISNAKFENTFGFKFKDSIESIVSEIKTHYQDIVFTNRDNGVRYE